MLNEEDILLELEVTDEMAFDSDIGGDSDAEDTIITRSSSTLSLEGIEALIPNSDTETIIINSNTVTGHTRSLRSQKSSLKFENTKLDSNNASTSADSIQSPLIHSPIYSTTDFTDWDDFDVIDNIATDETFLPVRLLSQVNDYECTDDEIEDEELNFNFSKTGKVPEKFYSSARNTRSY